MWIFVAFDLPAKTKADRKEYGVFRKHLLENGFIKMQFSLYSRFVVGTEQVEKYSKRIEQFLPPGGEVRVLVFTDKQFERMKTFCGKIRQSTPKQWEQLTFF
jgi:CRISPR-associated protein Cas2